jgi:hypothetical protein
VTFLLKAKMLLHPPSLTELGPFYQGLFFQWKGLERFYTSMPSIYVFFSICYLFGLALYINFLIEREKMFQRKSYLPALAFMMLSSILPVLNVFSFEMISGTFILLAVGKAFALYNSQKARRQCFDIGVFLALATFFYFPAIMFFILFIILIFVFRPFLLQEVMGYFLGFLTPIYLAAGILFVFGKVSLKKLNWFLHIHPPVALIKFPAFIVLTLSSIILLVYGFYCINQASSRNAMVIRKKWNAIVIYFIFACLAGCLSMIFPGTPWIMAIIPFSIILSSTLQGIKEKNNNFTFYFLVAVLIAVQVFL